MKEKLTIRMLMGSIVVKGNLSSVHIDKGLSWIVITMITFAIMIIITRLLSQRIDPFTITLYSNVVSLVVSVLVAFLLDNPLRLSSKVPDWVLLIGTAVVVHGVATLMWNNNIRHVDASKASILSNLESFVAMIMGLILLYKSITGAEILGSLFIVGGVVLSTYQRRKLHSRSN